MPRDGNVGDVLLEVRKRLGQEYEGRQLRLLEVSQNKIYKVGGCTVSWAADAGAVAARAVCLTRVAAGLALLYYGSGACTLSYGQLACPQADTGCSLRHTLHTLIVNCVYLVVTTTVPRHQFQQLTVRLCTRVALPQVADPAEEIGNWNENYWVLRVEPVPKDEETLSDDDTIIRVAHIPAPKQQPAPSTLSTAGNEPAGADAVNNASNNGSGGGAAAAGGLIGTGPAVNAPTGAVPFGDPFLLRVGPQETLGEVKGRIQEKLGVAAADFESWKFALVSTRAAPHYLAGER